MVFIILYKFILDSSEKLYYKHYMEIDFLGAKSKDLKNSIQSHSRLNIGENIVGYLQNKL